MCVTASLAQSVERKALNLVVVGSSPTVGDACLSLFSAWQQSVASAQTTEYICATLTAARVRLLSLFGGRASPSERAGPAFAKENTT